MLPVAFLLCSLTKTVVTVTKNVKSLGTPESHHQVSQKTSTLTADLSHHRKMHLYIFFSSADSTGTTHHTGHPEAIKISSSHSVITEDDIIPDDTEIIQTKYTGNKMIRNITENSFFLVLTPPFNNLSG